MAKVELEAVLKLRDELSAKVAQIDKALASLGRTGASSLKSLSETINKELTSTLQEFGGNAGRVGTILQGLGPAGIAAGAGIGLAVGIMGKGIKDTIELGEQLTRLKGKTGIGFQGLQELKFIAGQTGLEFEGVATSVARMGVNIGKGGDEVKKALGGIGLSLATIRGLEPEQQFLAITAAVKQLPTQFQQAAAMQEIFGKGGIELLPLLKEDVEGLSKTYHDLGLGIRDDVIEAGDRLGDNLKTLEGEFKALEVQLAGPFVEALAFVTDALLSQDAAVKNYLASFTPEGLRNLSSFVEQLLKASNIPFAGLGFELGQAITAAGTHGPIQGPPKSLAFSPAAEAEKLDPIMERVLENTRKFDAQIRTVQHTSSETFGTMSIDFGKVMTQAEELDLAVAGLNKELADAAQESKITQITNEFNKQADIAKQSFEAEVKAVDARRKEKDIAQEIAGIDVDLVTGLGEQRAHQEAITKSTEEWDRALQGAMALTTIIGGAFGNLLSNVVTLAGSIKHIFGEGGALGQIKSAFSGFGGGILKGLGSLFESAGVIGSFVATGISIGKAIVSGIKALFHSGPDLVRDASRDLGATISKDLAAQIEKSGKPLQLALAQIFEAGGFKSIDKFAEEIGDIFSGLQRGEFSKSSAISALEEAVPLLLEHLKELGPEGQAQIQRIIDAAKSMGVEFKGLGDLIQSTFAPKTMEEIAQQFSLTNDQVRAIGENLGINIQTNLEKVAASVGLTAKEFQDLGAALQTQFGIPADQLKAFLEATGISAQELAQKLGVDVGEGAALAADAQSQANQRILEGRDAASGLADELERAARASQGINVNVGAPPPGFQHGGYIPAHPPFGKIIRVAEREGEYITPRSKLGRLARGVSAHMQVVVNVAGGGDGRGVVDAIRKNAYGLRRLLQQVAEGKA